MKYLMRKKKGFTLVETLVAITILTIGIAGPMTVATNAMNAGALARDKISAFHFAQEGVEYVRYVRDSNILDTAGWLRYLDNCRNSTPCGIANPKNIVNNNNDFRDCNPCRIVWRSGQKVYAHSSSPNRKFIRNIRVNEIIADQEAEIEVTVGWETKGRTYTYTLRERIFNWSES